MKKCKTSQYCEKVNFRLLWSLPALPEDIHLILERLGFISKWCQLFILCFHIQEFFFKLFTTDPVVIFCSLQPTEKKHHSGEDSWLASPLQFICLCRSIYPYLKVSSCSCSSCVCSWRCLRPAGLFMSSMESDWLSLSIRTWFSANKLLFSSCRAATWRKEVTKRMAKSGSTKREKGTEKVGKDSNERYWMTLKERMVWIRGGKSEDREKGNFMESR